MTELKTGGRSPENKHLPVLSSRFPYASVPLVRDFTPGEISAPWPARPTLSIEHYLWLDNGYRPKVDVRLSYSERFLFVRFDVEERVVTIKHREFQAPVFKDSCVEFFIDAFPAKRRGYLNFETNAAGVLLAAFGPGRNERRPLSEEDIAGFFAVSSIADHSSGQHGTESWRLEYRLPLDLFAAFYGKRIRPGNIAAANFYKCGDETEVPHYGAWSPIETAEPDFHRPECFGTLEFQKKR